MGCYDEIRFLCPKCGREIYAQSKGGACNMATYEARDVPLDVASNANRHPIVCPGCHQSYKAVSAGLTLLEI